MLRARRAAAVRGRAERRACTRQYLRAPFGTPRRFRDVDLVVDVANGMLFYSPLWRRGPRLCLVHHVHAEQWERYFPQPGRRGRAGVEARGLPLVYRGTHLLADSVSTVRRPARRSASIAPTSTSLNLGVDLVRARRAGRALDGADVPGARAARAEQAPRPAPRPLGPGRPADRRHAASSPATGPSATHLAGSGRRRARRSAGVVARGPGHRGPQGRAPGPGVADGPPGRARGLGTHDHRGRPVRDSVARATGSPGVRDAVVDGTTGVLVDSDEEFVKEWIALSQQPDRRAELAAARRGPRRRVHVGTHGRRLPRRGRRRDRRARHVRVP